MLACLSTTPDFVPDRYSLGSSRIVNLGSREALTVLQNCSSFKQLKQIHAKIIRVGLSHDQLLIRKLLHLSSSYGKMDYATLVFNQIRAPRTFTWNIMIRAYTMNGCSDQAFLLYKLMLCRGFPPDKFTFPFVIKACMNSSSFLQGVVVHGLAVKYGSAGDSFVQNTLMDLYFKCRNTIYARRVFEKMRDRNVVSWTTMISGLVSCGELHAARVTFEQMPTKNVVSWTAMINGYVRNQQPEEAFELFRRMQLDNVRPNEFTLVSLLKACTELGSLKLGRWIHDFALKNEFKLEVFLGTALIDMYSKCGSLEDARIVFDKMQSKSLATWNSMITGLGVHGFGEEALALFAEMENRNVEPDAITFVGVLCACLQTNNLSEGRKYFEYMTLCYGISPIVEHYACMIELYGRAGMLDEVYRLVKTVQDIPNYDVVLAQLSVNGHDITDVSRFTLKPSEDIYCYTSEQQHRYLKWDVG